MLIYLPGNLSIILFCSPTAGTSLNSLGKIGFGIILAISAYFIYNNYIKNPEFSKSLNLSKEASKRYAQEQSAE